MPLPFNFDFKNPDYLMVFEWRLERLKHIRKNPQDIPALKLFYKNNPDQFIIDWGMTFDPRNLNKKLPPIIPFLLFPKQEEFVHWFMKRLEKNEPGVVEKSRDMGITWLTMAIIATVSIFHENSAIGLGSRKEDLVDKSGNPDCLFYKIKQFINLLPTEFRAGFIEKKHAKHMLITFPDSGSVIMGEAGRNIGRGGRARLQVNDESAFFEHPEDIERSLSATTDCRFDISTPNGTNNPFYRKVTSGNINKFTFHWRDDPRKDEEWYRKKCHEIDDPVIIAQELDLDYSGSVEGIVIPTAWIQAAVDLHIRLKLDISGIRKIGFDVADDGKDLNAICGRHGILVKDIESWSGKESDIYRTVQKVIQFCDVHHYNEITYDADGLGAGVRGDANNINKEREFKIKFEEFTGSGEVINPDKNIFYNDAFPEDEKSKRTNKDYFSNFKAQSWWALRRRFLRSYRVNNYLIEMEKLNNIWIAKDIFDSLKINLDDIICISSTLLHLNKLITELSQPTFSQNNAGKILIDKKPDGARSPNLADAVMIAFAEVKRTGSLANINLSQLRI